MAHGVHRSWVRGGDERMWSIYVRRWRLLTFLGTTDDRITVSSSDLCFTVVVQETWRVLWILLSHMLLLLLYLGHVQTWSDTFTAGRVHGPVFLCILGFPCSVFLALCPAFLAFPCVNVSPEVGEP